MLRPMSKAAKATEPTFEDALGRLESIVETMEAGELPLEQLMNRFEEGTRLVKFCQDRLAAADLRLQQLQTDAAGNPVTRPLDDDLAPGEGGPAAA
jgi:exodeoxyribonuclease VII small subunit